MNIRECYFQELQQIADGYLVSSYTEYANKRTLLKFICKECNVPYSTTHFLYEKKNGDLCNSCCNSKQSISPIELYVLQVQEKHGSYYDYSKLVKTTKTVPEQIIIICPEHGDIKVSSRNHMNNFEGCDHCQINNTLHINSARHNFIIKAHQTHNFKYIYDNTVFDNNYTTLDVECPKHGVFSVLPSRHIDEKEGCPICSTSEVLINKITKMLDDLKINYSTEKTFSDCKSKEGRALHFDIFVHQCNLCIEVDGIHHYQVTKFSPDTTTDLAKQYFKVQQQNDDIKSNYCENNNINFIRIPYTESNPDAVVKQYIQNLPMQRVLYSWNDFEVDVRRIINYIKTFNYPKFAVYGVMRGGLPIAVCVSNHFDDMSEFGVLKFQRYSSNDKVAEIPVGHQTSDIPIFIIDDLISSGITMDKAVEKLSQQYPSSNIHPIVVFGNENDKDIFIIREHPKQWIVFPYEV